MYIILLAVIVIVGYFIADTFITKISLISTMPGKSWTLGMGWFLVLAILNIAVVIFIPVYYYTHDDTGKMGAAGNTGRQGVSGLTDSHCDCNL